MQLVVRRMCYFRAKHFTIVPCNGTQLYNVIYRDISSIISPECGSLAICTVQGSFMTGKSGNLKLEISQEVDEKR